MTAYWRRWGTLVRLLEGDTADEVWLLAAAEVRSRHGLQRVDGRGGPVWDLGRAAFIIRDPRRRWVHSRRPAMNPAFALAEVIWILAGREDAAFLNFFNPGLPRYAGRGDTYTGAYGQRLRHEFGLDQLVQACQALSGQPNSRQVALQIWAPQRDLPRQDGAPAHEDVPCNVCALLKLRDGRLEWTQIMRSSDLLLGTPHNFVQFTSMQEVMAGWLGVQLGSFCLVTDCLHVYETRLDEVCSAVPTPQPVGSPGDLCLAETASRIALHGVVELTDRMVIQDIADAELVRVVQDRDLPAAWSDLLCVLAADYARRRGWPALVTEVMTRCRDPWLHCMWQSWERRKAVEGDAASTDDQGRCSSCG